MLQMMHEQRGSSLMRCKFLKTKFQNLPFSEKNTRASKVLSNKLQCFWQANVVLIVGNVERLVLADNFGLDCECLPLRKNTVAYWSKV